MNIKYLILVLIFGLFSVAFNAQNTHVKIANYTLKGSKIYKDGKDVTTTLTEAEQEIIKKSLQEEKDEAKAKLKQQKDLKKAEKEIKKETQKRKKAAKALKRKETTQANYNKAKNNLEKTQAKFERLKAKGKLSPIKEIQYEHKLEKLNEKFIKAEKKLKSI